MEIIYSSTGLTGRVFQFGAVQAFTLPDAPFSDNFLQPYYVKLYFCGNYIVRRSLVLRAHPQQDFSNFLF